MGTMQELCQQLKNLMVEMKQEKEKQGVQQQQCTPIYMMPMMCPCEESNSSDSDEDPTIEKDPRDRTRHFYNGYNMDWRQKRNKKRHVPKLSEADQKAFDKGVTVGGLSPVCDKANSKPKENGKKDPIIKAIISPMDKNCCKYCAKIPAGALSQKKSKQADDKAKKVSGKGYFSVQTDPNEEPCKYGLPCKAQCFNHPPEMRAIHFY